MSPALSGTMQETDLDSFLHIHYIGSHIANALSNSIRIGHFIVNSCYIMYFYVPPAWQQPV